MKGISIVKDMYSAEEICGFRITGLMKRAWAVQLDVLNVISDICTKYNLTWFADWGTLLGAIRHKGFIPWDDDVDICMMREDYEKLLMVIPNEIPTEWTIIHAGSVHGRYSPILRVVNSSKVDFSNDFLQMNHGCPYACGVDIFPLDNVPNDVEEWELLQQLVKQILLADKLIDNVTKEEKYRLLKDIEQVSGISFNQNVDVHKQLYLLIDALSKSYNSENCDYIVNIWQYAFGEGKSPLHRLWYDKAIKREFQDSYVYVPAGYNDVLCALYGEDYMTPIIGTAMHQYPFYNVQKQEAHDRLNTPTDYIHRERRVAEKMDMDITEVFEYSLVEKNDRYKMYVYFCQYGMCNITFSICDDVVDIKRI